MNNNTVLLETMRKDRDNSQNLLFTDPVDIIVCRKPADVQECFREMESYRQKGFFLAGFFAYELGYFLEETLNLYRPKSDYPLLWFGVFKRPLRRLPCSSEQEKAHYHLSEPQLATTYPHYASALRKIKNRIAHGETYQINYTTRYDFNFFGSIRDFYSRLKENQHVSYSAIIHYDGNYIISLSPELFFRIDARQNITVKPMKGTAPLSTSARWLRNDQKNTSENVMIVDLLRNDLGRICLPGSVKVKKLFAVEKYKTLLQMTSTVAGKLQPTMKISDIIKSLFPCGSVTGAPKIQSMKIISSLEDGPRQIYTGAIGYFAPDGSAVFNVAIRTIDLRRQPNHTYRGRMGIGGGIVYDSRPKDEFAECRLKARFLIEALPEFALIETMLFANGKIKCLNSHLQRLKSSASFFSIPYPVEKIRTTLKDYVSELAGDIRLRLLLKSDGNFTIKHQSAPSRPVRIPPVAISRFKTDSDDPFLQHKTTHRKLYDEEYKKYSAQGYFDVLFRNEKDEMTEGAISNLFIQTRGNWYTPPLSCGLLNGIARRTLIKKLNVREKILFLKDIQSADQIILTNSVRGENQVSFRGRI